MIKVKTFFLWIPTPLICVQSAEQQKPKAQPGGKYAPRGIIVIDGVVSVLKKILDCLYKPSRIYLKTILKQNIWYMLNQKFSTYKTCSVLVSISPNIHGEEDINILE